MIYTETKERAFLMGMLVYSQGIPIATAPYSRAELNEAWWNGYHEAKNRRPQTLDDGTQGYGQKPMGVGL